MSSLSYSMGKSSVFRAKQVQIGVVVTLFVVVLSFFKTLRSWTTPRDVKLSSRISRREPVAIHLYDSSFYTLDEAGLTIYEHMMPTGGHLVHLVNPERPRSPPETYTVTLFHQLKCLEIYHREYLRYSEEPSALVDHCLNYLRQTILCRPDLRVDSIQAGNGKVTLNHDAVCRDWSAVYEEAEKNLDEFREWTQVSGSGHQENSR